MQTLRAAVDARDSALEDKEKDQKKQANINAASDAETHKRAMLETAARLKEDNATLTRSLAAERSRAAVDRETVMKVRQSQLVCFRVWSCDGRRWGCRQRTVVCAPCSVLCS